MAILAASLAELRSRPVSVTWSCTAFSFRWDSGGLIPGMDFSGLAQLAHGLMDLKCDVHVAWILLERDC